MKQNSGLYILLMVLVISFSSCELVGDIFQAGLVVGIIAVVAIIAIIIWIINRFRR